MSMAIAAGPYTLDDDLSYAPFETLIDNVVEETPDVLVLASVSTYTFGFPAHTPLSLDRSSTLNIR